jgi:glutamyl-Q tRNA(Asp) synthetase
MDKAGMAVSSTLAWTELGSGETKAIKANIHAWGDFVIARKETPTSYHISVVVDDALQGVTDVVRGKDLFEQTAIHRLLQSLLDLPTPRYFHHRLITADDGEKLAKSASSMPLRELRSQGVTANEIRQNLGF